MKKVVAAGLIWGLLGTSVLASGFIGTPTAGLDKGQWSAGYEYAYSEQELEKTEVPGTQFTLNANREIVGSSSDGYTLKIKELKIHRHDFSLAYGIESWWEITASIGAADLKMDTTAPFGRPISNLDTDYAWGLGTKFTFFKQDKIDWGLAAKWNWMDNQADTSSTTDIGGGTLVRNKLETMVEYWDLVIALGPTIDLGGWKLYGGPFYYYLDGDIKNRNTSSTYTGGTYTGGSLLKESGELKAEDHWGGYLGTQFALVKNWDTHIELSFTPDGWGVGAALQIQF